MRIAIVAPPWLPVPPNGYGGTEAVLDTLARGLAEAGHDVLLYTTGDSTCPVPRAYAFAEAIGTVRTDTATELHHVVNAYDTIRAWQPDVVHDHTLTGPLYALNLGLPVVTTNHGPFEVPLYDLYRAIAPRVPVIAISEHHAASAGDLPIAAVIHHGVDVERFRFVRHPDDYVAFLGRMSPDKGVHRAIHIARAAGVPLRIAAKLCEPAEWEYFKEKVEPLLGGDIEYVGEVAGSAKLEFLAHARCLLNPIAWAEPFGMVMIEALASGVPVVATARGSAPELIDDGTTGYVRDSDEALVEAVQHVHEIDRARCRKEALVRFSRERMVEDHLELYERVAVGEPVSVKVALAT